MQTTSTDYKLEIKKPSRSFECKITIGNNIYTNDDIVDIILETIQPGEGFSIGNTPSQTLDLTLVNRGDTIYSTSQVKVEVGLKIGATIENILMGLFNIDDIEKTDYTTKFTCYDNMIRFETPYFSSLTYPASLQQVVNELATKTGVQFTGSLPAYTVKKLEGFTCREILGYVSSLCGGNALITRDGKFTIVTPKDIDHSITPDNYIDYKREEVKYKIGKVSCKVGDKELNKGSLGTDSMEVKFENPWVTDSILNDIYTKLNGFEYLGYTMKWQGDISLDVGDIVTCTDIKGAVRKIPILSQKFTYNGGLTAEIGAKGETKNKNNFNSSGSGSNKLDRVVTELLIVNEALINKANIQDLEAVSIRTQTIEAKTAAIEVAIIDVAHVSDLTAINANIEKLIAADATMGQAIIGKANIADLTASVGRIEILETSVGDIQTLVNGNLTSNNIQSLILSSDKVTVVNGFIKNAMIENLDVSKINAGDISVNKFRIKSDSGNLLIFDNTIQIKDSTRVRVQIGKDASNDYSMYVWDSSGKLMFDATGLKADGIKQKIIRDDMVSDNANIQGSKLNISSVVTSINNGAATLNSSKVHIDGTAQTLDVAFNALTTKVDSAPPSITTDSSITKLDGAIDGMLKINSISGRTLKNEVVNGDFSNGTSRWGIGNATASVVNGEVVMLASSNIGRLEQRINGNNGNKLYQVALIKTTSSLVGLGVGGSVLQKHSGSGNYERISNIYAIGTLGYMFTSVADNRTSGWDNIYIKRYTVVNLTAMFGVGNEPTKEWCDANISFFEGIQSVGESENLELVSCGKNLFDKNKVFKGYLNSSTGDFVPYNTRLCTDFIPLSAGEGVASSLGDIYISRFFFYDVEKKFISAGSSAKRDRYNIYQVTPTNTKYIRVQFLEKGSSTFQDIFDLIGDTLQIEKGTSSTSYEPYKGHRQHLSLTNSLRGLPNGVRDTVDFERGVVVRNVGKVLLDDNVANYSVHTTTDTLIQFRIEALKNKRLNLPVTPVICTHFNYYGNHSLTPSREGIYAINSDDLTFSGICYIAIEKSKLKTLDVAGFVQWLQSNPTTIYYQLATPVEEPIDVEQYMKQFKDGYFLTEGSLINPIVDLTYSTSLASATSMMKEVTESNTTALNIQQGKISALISNTTIVKDGQTIQLKDSYNSTVATVNYISNVISEHTSTIDGLTGQIGEVETKTNDIRRDLDGTIEIVSQTTTTANNALSKASEAQQTADGFLQRVSNVEQTTLTIDDKVTNITERVNTAEQKITSDAIVSTVRSSNAYTNDLGAKVSSNEIISCINQTSEAVKISASKINLTGYVTVTNLSTAGQTIINGGNIKTGTITGVTISGVTLNGVTLNASNTVTIGTTSSGANPTIILKNTWAGEIGNTKIYSIPTNPGSSNESDTLYITVNSSNNSYKGKVYIDGSNAGCDLEVRGDVSINSGFLVIGGKQFRGWGFSSGNTYWFGISGDDKYVRMYNNDVTVANGVTYIGSPSGRYIKVYSTQAADVSSDRRKKTNILAYDEKIEMFYDNLKPISYELINGHSGRKHYGFIAQDVEDAMGVAGLNYKDMALLQKAPMDAEGNEIDPTTIVDYSTDERIVDYEYSLAYTEMISINTHMIQKLRAEITKLKNEISEIKGLG